MENYLGEPHSALVDSESRREMVNSDDCIIVYSRLVDSVRRAHNFWIETLRFKFMQALSSVVYWTRNERVEVNAGLR